ncbi:MAG: S-layer homology domain-containing protein [Bacillota bacterium]
MFRRRLLLLGWILFFTISLSRVAFAGFKDAPTPESWVYRSFKLVYDAGLIKGYPDGTFRGNRPATRNEVVEFMARLMRYFEARLAGAKPDRATVAGMEKKYLTEEEVKALLKEELAKRETGLSEEEIARRVDEIYEAIRDLEEEFREELDGLDLRVTTLEEKTAAIEETHKAREAETAGLRRELEAAKENLARLQAQMAQDRARAEEEAKKAKRMGYLGMALGLLGLLFGIF